MFGRSFLWPFALLLLLAAIDLVFQRPPAPPVATRPAPAPTSQPADPSCLLSVSEAESVREYIFDEKPEMDPSAQFPLVEITTEDVASRLSSQVFRVTEGAWHFEAFLIRDRKVMHLGSGSGGRGVNSMRAIDLDADGRMDLLYTYSFGSGLHRATIGVLEQSEDTQEEWVERRVHFGLMGDYDLTLKTGSAGQIELWAVCPLEEEATVRVGAIAYGSDADSLAVKLDDDLPEDIREAIRSWYSGD